MENDEAATLRIRAGTLRLLALRIIVAPVQLLAAQAGESTWIGPTPQRCHEELTRLRRYLTSASDDLELRARRLEVQADLLESTTGGPGLSVR